MRRVTCAEENYLALTGSSMLLIKLTRALPHPFVSENSAGEKRDYVDRFDVSSSGARDIRLIPALGLSGQGGRYLNSLALVSGLFI